MPEEDWQRIQFIEVEVGEFSGVVAEALEFGYEMVASGTPFEASALLVTRVETRVRCDKCGTEAGLDAPLFLCGRCGSTRIEVLSGMDVSVKQVTLRDDRADAEA